MKKKLKIFTSLHKSTKRNYLKRMMDNKAYYMKIAKKYSKDYWDGTRRSGYGGYRYIENYWTPVAMKIIKQYRIKNDEILFIGDSLLDYQISLEANLKFMGIGSLISQRIKKNIFCIKSFNQTEDIFSKFTLKQKKIF